MFVGHGLSTVGGDQAVPRCALSGCGGVGTLPGVGVGGAELRGKRACPPCLPFVGNCLMWGHVGITQRGMPFITKQCMRQHPHSALGQPPCRPSPAGELGVEVRLRAGVGCSGNQQTNHMKAEGIRYIILVTVLPV